MDKQDKERFFEEIKGIRRIVINAKHGGFGLSEAAVVRYLELQGVQCWPGKEKWGGKTWWLVPPGPERLDGDVDHEVWRDMTTAERQAFNRAYRSQTFQDREIERDDPYLVKVVLELGKEASGKFAELKVVEIPDDVEWVLQEYDGSEWIAEKHRTWH